MKNINWGIVTAGNISHTFAKDMAFVEGASIHAVAARTQQSADSFALQYGIKHGYEGYEGLFEDPHIDAIYIGSPHTLHVEHAASALRAGKHVLCEKPITTTVEDLTYLIGLAQDNNCFLMEAMWTYFLPAVQAAKRWVDQGQIGKLLHVRADFGYPFDYDPTTRVYNAALCGGCLYDMGIYPIAFNWLFNSQLPQSLAVQKHYAPNGVEDDVLWQISYPEDSDGDRLHASLHTSFRAKLPNKGILIGTEGTIQVDDFWRSTGCTLFERDTPKAQFDDERLGSGFEFQIDHVCDCIRKGQIESDIMTWNDSLALQRQLAELRNWDENQ